MADVSAGKIAVGGTEYLPVAYFNHKKNIVTIQSKQKSFETEGLQMGSE
jgi:hypothetical protein